jgi:hypothetical protein
MVESWGGPALGAVCPAPAKVAQVLPVAPREDVERSRVDRRQRIGYKGSGGTL